MHNSSSSKALLPILGPVACVVAGLVRVHPGGLPTATDRRWEGAGQRVMQ